MRKNSVIGMICILLVFTGFAKARPNHWAQNGALDIFYATPVEPGLLSINILHLGTGYSLQLSGHNYTSIGFAPLELVEISAAIYLDGFYNDSDDYRFGPVMFSPALRFGYPIRFKAHDNFLLAPGLLVKGNFSTPTSWSADATPVPDPDPSFEAQGIVSFSTGLVGIHLNAGYRMEFGDIVHSIIPYGLAVQVTPLQMLDAAVEATNRAPLTDFASIDYLTVTPLVRLNLAPMGGWSFDLSVPVGIGSAVAPWRVELGVSVGFDVLHPPKVPVGRINGRVISEETGQPIAANLVFPEREIEPVSVDPLTGEYSLVLPPGVYRIRAEAVGFKWKEKGVVLQDDEQKVVDFTLVGHKEPIAQLSGTVKDEETGQALEEVTVSLGRTGLADLTTDVLGIFKTSLPPGEYSLTFAKPGYGDATFPVTLEDGDSEEFNVVMGPPPPDSIESDGPAYEEEIPREEPIVEEEPVVTEEPSIEEEPSVEEEPSIVEEPDATEESPIDEPVGVPASDAVFKNVLFNPGSATISSQSYGALKEVVKYLEVYPSVKLSIEGHTDSVGPADGNLRLSQQRADAVKAWLVSEGVDPDRLTAKGYGETHPVSDNRSRSGQNANRRIEFIVLSE